MQLVQQLMMSGPNVPILTFDHYSLSVKDTHALASAVSVNAYARGLSLSSNVGVGDEGVHAVCSMLCGQTRISSLSLSRVGCSEQAAPALEAMLASNLNITTLQLASNHLGDLGAAIVARILTFGFARRTALTCLDISDNKIGSEGAARIAAMLEGNDTLRTLDVSWNGIRGRGAQLVAAAVGNLLGLTTLRMSRNGIGDAGLALGRSLGANPSLTELDVASCRLGPAAAGALAAGLRRNAALTKLTLDWNPLCEGARELHAALVQRSVQHGGLVWSMDNVAWDWVDRSVPPPAEGRELSAGGRRGSVSAGGGFFELSGRHLLDLRSPHDKHVFLRLAQYALERGADCWRNEMFLEQGTWKRFWFSAKEFSGENGVAAAPRWLSQTRLQVDVLGEVPGENEGVLGSQAFEQLLWSLERAKGSLEQLAMLRDLEGGVRLSSEQAREVFELCCVQRGSQLRGEAVRGDAHPKEVAERKGEVFVALSARVGDGRLHKVLELLEEAEQAALVARVGPLRVFNGEQPEGRYALDLGKPGDRQVLKRLARMRGERGARVFTRRVAVAGEPVGVRHAWYLEGAGDLAHLVASWPVDTFFFAHGFEILAPEPKRDLSRGAGSGGGGGGGGGGGEVEFQSVLEVLAGREEFRAWAAEALDEEAEGRACRSALRLVERELRRSWVEEHAVAAAALQAAVQRRLALRLRDHLAQAEPLPEQAFMELEVLSEAAWLAWVPTMEEIELEAQDPDFASDGFYSRGLSPIGALARARTLSHLASKTQHFPESELHPRPHTDPKLPQPEEEEATVYEREYETPPDTAGSGGSGVRWQLQSQTTRARKLDNLTAYKADKSQVWGGSLLETAKKPDSRISTPFVEARKRGEALEAEIKSEMKREAWWNLEEEEDSKMLVVDDAPSTEKGSEEGGEGGGGEGEGGQHGAASRDGKRVTVESAKAVEPEESMQQRVRRKFASVQRTIRSIQMMRKAMKMGLDERAFREKFSSEEEKEGAEKNAEEGQRAGGIEGSREEEAAAKAERERRERAEGSQRPATQESQETTESEQERQQKEAEAMRERQKLTKPIDPHFHSMHKGRDQSRTPPTSKPRSREFKAEAPKPRRLPPSRREQMEEESEFVRLLSTDEQGGGRNLNLKSVLGVADFDEGAIPGRRGRQRRKSSVFTPGTPAVF